MSTRDPSPEHAASRVTMDKLAAAAGLPSGQAFIKHIDGLQPDSAEMKLIGEAIAQTVPKAAPPAGSTPPGLKVEPENA